MSNNILINNSLSQFEVIPLIKIFFSGFDFSITNYTLMYFILFFIFIILFYINLNNKDFTLNFMFIYSTWEYVVITLYKLIVKVVKDNIVVQRGSFFFPLIFSIFIFILSLNCFGLIPYSFTIASHFIVTFIFSFFLFLGLNIIFCLVHKFKIFSLFLPGETSFVLAFLLVPIEFISYIFKPVSLSIRLFANMMAGHTLLKVIAGFALSLMTSKGFYFVLYFLTLFILVPLFLLELGVAIIQSFVFSILITIYINDGFNFH